MMFSSCKNGGEENIKEKKINPPEEIFSSTVLMIDDNDDISSWQNFKVLKQLVKNIIPSKTQSLKVDSIYKDIFSKTSLALEQLKLTKQSIPSGIDDKSLISRFLRLETYLVCIKNTLNEANKKNDYQGLKLNFDDVHIAYNAVYDEIKRLSSRNIRHKALDLLSTTK